MCAALVLLDPQLPGIDETIWSGSADTPTTPQTPDVNDQITTALLAATDPQELPATPPVTSPSTAAVTPTLSGVLSAAQDPPAAAGPATEQPAAAGPGAALPEPTEQQQVVASAPAVAVVVAPPASPSRDQEQKFHGASPCIKRGKPSGADSSFRLQPWC